MAEVYPNGYLDGLLRQRDERIALLEAGLRRIKAGIEKYATDGFWSGLSVSIGLTVPIYNTLRHWKHRKLRLVISGSALSDATVKTGAKHGS